MHSKDLTTILDVVINLVSGDRELDQNVTEVRDFKVSASRLIAQLNATKPKGVANDSKDSVGDGTVRTANDYR
jgi:hypothetical protein